MSELRHTGIDALGEIPWGSHFCNFYETKQDLLDTLVPYFKAGLESNEFCLWVVSNSGLITVQEAKEALAQVVPEFDRHLSDKNIEILTELDWYLQENMFNLERVTNAWDVKLKRALALGYEGMRVSGDTFWLKKKDWENFCAYEKQLDDSITDMPMTALCTYPLSKSGAIEILDVVQNHKFAVARRQGEWEIIESPELFQANLEIKRLNEELEQRVVERTKELAATNIELRREIAERKHAEEELKKEKEILAKIFDNIPVMIGFVADDGVKLVNPEWERTIGWTLKELQEQNVDIFAEAYPDPSYRQEVLDFVAASIGEWKDLKIKVRDGRVIDAACAIVRLSDGTRVAIAQDITERKQAEDALRKSEDRIRLIIDTIPTMAWTVRLDGIVDFYNQRWLDYAGEGAIEDPNGIVHPEDLPDVMEKWLAKMAAEEPFEGEMRLRRADGEYRWFLVRTAPLRDEKGNLVKWYGVSTDIEDSERAKDALRESEHRYLSLFENMAEGVGYFRLLFKDGKLQDAIYLEVNPAWENLTGLKNVIGRKITEVLPGILQANSEFFERATRVALTGQSERFEAYSTQLKKWLSTSAYCPKKEHVIVVLDDITERKLADETLQRSYEEIRRLTEHLQKIREEERTSIAREIHDELGQQISVLKFDVSWLNKKLNGADRAVKEKVGDLLELLETMVESVRRISSELRPSLLDNLGLVAAMEWHLKEFEKRSGIKIIFNEPKEELEIADSMTNGLFRIFQESLTNVARHSMAKKVTVELLQKNDQLILSIEDDGKGFDKQKAAEMKTLGILGMRERSMMMGGSYEIKSILGKGTSVTVVLPYKLENHMTNI